VISLTVLFSLASNKKSSNKNNSSKSNSLAKTAFSINKTSSKDTATIPSDAPKTTSLKALYTSNSQRKSNKSKILKKKCYPNLTKPTSKKNSNNSLIFATWASKPKTNASSLSSHSPANRTIKIFSIGPGKISTNSKYSILLSKRPLIMRNRRNL
jgi:hypothetical protein